MAIENILMPQLGESVTEGTIEKWLVKPGDTVNKYDPLAEVNTDKVTCRSSFLFYRDHQGIDCTGRRNTRMSERLSVRLKLKVQSTLRKKPKRMAKGTGKRNAGSRFRGTILPLKSEKGKAAGRFSPAVLRLAQDNGIDFSLVEGSGLEGRITRKDLLAIIESGNIPTASAVSVLQTRLHHLLQLHRAASRRNRCTCCGGRH